MRTPGWPQIAYQQAGTASLGSRANSIMRGSQNMDLPLPQFLLNVQTDLGEHVYQKLMAYAAELQMLGILAGVIEGPTEEYRAAVKKAVGSYFDGLLSRSQRTSWWENSSPLDAASTSLGYWYKLWGAGANAVGAERASKLWDDAGNKLITTDPDKLLFNLGADIVGSLWDDCKKRWEEFWKDFNEKGLLVAYGKLQIDAAFLAAEIAITVALSTVTEGAAAAAFAGIKIVGRRVSSTVTRVVVRAVNRAAKGVPESGILLDIPIPDNKINQRILREVFDEDKLGVGTKRQDVGRRAEEPVPPVEKPQGKGAGGPDTKKLTRGKNENEIAYDPKTGRPIGAKGTLREDFGATKRGDNATAIGKLGDTGDQGGHLVGHRFMGDTPDYGIAPQAGNLNTGAWKKMENEWADWIKKGYEVDYQIDVYPPGSVRPDSFDVVYKIRDPKTGELKYRKRKEFENKAGETFDRVPFRDME